MVDELEDKIKALREANMELVEAHDMQEAQLDSWLQKMATAREVIGEIISRTIMLPEDYQKIVGILEQFPRRTRNG